MPEFPTINENDLAMNEVRQITVDGYAPIAIYNIDGEFFATDDTCSHGEASLAEGDIEGGEIVCPFHMGAFDIRTGKASVPPCVQPIRTHKIRIDDGIVYVAIEE